MPSFRQVSMSQPQVEHFCQSTPMGESVSMSVMQCCGLRRRRLGDKPPYHALGSQMAEAITTR